MTNTKLITDDKLREAVNKSKSIAGVLRELGVRQAGGSHSHYSRRIKNLQIDTVHFTGQAHNRGSVSPIKRLAKDILVLRLFGNRQKGVVLTRALLESGIPHCCAKCGQPPEWLGHKLTLDVDHMNENWLDDRIENLRFLCPNCHSQFSRNIFKKENVVLH